MGVSRCINNTLRCFAPSLPSRSPLRTACHSTPDFSFPTRHLLSSPNHSSARSTYTSFTQSNHGWPRSSDSKHIPGLCCDMAFYRYIYNSLQHESLFARAFAQGHCWLGRPCHFPLLGTLFATTASLRCALRAKALNAPSNRCLTLLELLSSKRRSTRQDRSPPPTYPRPSRRSPSRSSPMPGPFSVLRYQNWASIF